MSDCKAVWLLNLIVKSNVTIFYRTFKKEPRRRGCTRATHRDPKNIQLKQYGRRQLLYFAETQ
jgi:hypothetical protein